MGRRRQYCRQSCRQRAYEQRASINGAKGGSLPADAVVLSGVEAADLSDRVYQVRCAAEDVATALDEGAGVPELRELCATRALAWADWWRVQSRHGSLGNAGISCGARPRMGWACRRPPTMFAGRRAGSTTAVRRVTLLLIQGFSPD